ncbi:MAG: PSD1 domain-containing protein [Bryobacteraceae bacterium]|nr:PSD1 domain-containing protein [Bryobacteraceae bacterium]
MRIRLLVIIPVLLVAETYAAEKLRFNRDVRPILSEKCLACHGPDRNSRQANLRLDVREAALERGAIKPGDVNASKLAQRIRHDKVALQMPPRASNKTLSENEKATLERWIAEGAEYEPHWAYIKPVRPPAPAGAEGIDHLVDARLKERGLRPVGEADRRTLIRRLSLDLTGLPPAPAEVAAFVNDPDPQAYEKLLDRLLASPHYGERMAVYWLDLVRYADTVGYHSDVPFSVYPYRDYVIRSFNENKPFDEFTREQLGGDLLPDSTPRQKAAAAYNRLARMTNEGGAQPKEYLLKYAADRVRTTSSAWLGSTLGCAECHDHKFDPFLTKDFYRFSAFFADIKEEGVYLGHGDFGPRVRVPGDAQAKEIEAIGRQLEQLRREGDGKLDGADAVSEFAAYIHEQASAWYAPRANVSSRARLRFRQMKDGVLIANGPVPRDDLQQVELKLKRGRVAALRLEAFRDHRFTGDDRDCAGFLLTGLEIDLLRGGRRQPLPVEVAVASYEPPEFPVRDALDDNNHTGWGVAADDDREDMQALFALAEPLEAKSGDRLIVKLRYEGHRTREALGKFRLTVSGSAFPDLVPEGEPESNFRAFTRSNPRWQEIRRLERRRKALVDSGDECVTTGAVEPRTVRVLPRGDWMNESGEIVEPGAPSFLKQLPTAGRATRLDLADWLVDRDNPLTARVFVNRLWKMYFGTGISKVLDDLGSQGEWPTNPELLDWLAVEFMDSGWDVKRLVRTMLLTNAYRRSSVPTPELKEADPYNRYYARQAMMRLDAEFVRDAALAVGGLLNPAIGGRSAKPYQPALYYRELNFPKREYAPDYDANQFRRGVYTHWQRTFVHPWLVAFDAPAREECAAERPVSNTPLQSLTLLNDPSYVEAARALAVRILESDAAGAAARIDFAFREAFSRDASPSEREILTNFLENQLAAFRKNRNDAKKLLAVGISPYPRGMDAAELAAWTGVARAIINKHEFIMRY